MKFRMRFERARLKIIWWTADWVTPSERAMRVCVQPRLFSSKQIFRPRSLFF
jgi:hypothetical protein